MIISEFSFLPFPEKQSSQILDLLHLKKNQIKFGELGIILAMHRMNFCYIYRVQVK